MKPVTRLLIPVWGLGYVRQLASFGLAALAAPGNLPALADATDLRIVFLTTGEGRRYLEGQSIVRYLGSVAPVEFIAIDDLTSATLLYAAPLTWAYWRGIQSAGDAMTDTHFVFMNADFVLADGSLRSLAQRIVEGHRVILTSNLRVNSEDAEPDLLRHVDTATGVMAIPPRSMVRFSLRHQHATQIAKTMTSGVCHSVMMNQLFWRADEDTVISHHYLAFMLALRPERVVHEINGFCDYAFVPELCPTSPSVALEDSDEFCMIELQKKMQEFTLLRMGRMPEEELRRNVAGWTTAAHRRSAVEHQIIFHAGDITPEARAMAAEARAFVAELDRSLSPEAKPATGHPFWTTLMRSMEDVPVQPLESPPDPVTAAARLRRLVAGTPPRLPSWHPDWLDYRALAARLDAFRADPDGGRLLYVHGKRRVLAEALATETAFPTDTVPISTVFDMRDRFIGHAGEPRRLIVVELDRDNADGLDLLVRPLMAALAPGGRLVFFLHDPRFWTSALALAFDMRHMLVRFSPAQVYPHELRMAGGEKRRPLLKLHRWLLDRVDAWGVRALPLVMLVLPALALLAARRNREEVPFHDGGLARRDTSGFTLTLSKP